MQPDPWISNNPRLAHDAGLALTTARVAAAAVVIEAQGLPPRSPDADPTPEQKAASDLGKKVLDAILRTLGADKALQARGDLPAVTVPELYAAYQHGL